MMTDPVEAAESLRDCLTPDDPFREDVERVIAAAEDQDHLVDQLRAENKRLRTAITGLSQEIEALQFKVDMVTIRMAVGL